MFVRARVGFAAFLLAALGSACSGTDGEVCLSDRSCPTGHRCEETTKGEPKICVPCDPDEIPYDGLDNDCNTRTKDSDLDGDGDNASDATVRPGTDCDDNDPLINVRQMEACADRKDNNCDGRVDEPECGDRNPPSVRILQPMEGQLVSGTILVEVEGDDDVSVMELRLFVEGTEVDSSPTESQTFSLDTTPYPDGTITIRAEALDIADRTARTEITVQLDNHTPPTLAVNSPVAGLSYGGLLTLEATATDGSGIASMTAGIDSMPGMTVTSTGIRIQIDTDGLDEGMHVANFRAVDRNNNLGSTDVNFFVDRSPPNINISVDPIMTRVVSGVFTVTITATDPAGIQNISGAAGPETGTSRTSPLRITVDSLAAPRIPNGPFFITATASDDAIIDGNPNAVGTSTTVTLEVVLENIPPEPIVTFTSPQDNWGVFRLTDISAAVTSPVGNTISRVEFAVNGVTIATDTMAPYQTQFDFTNYVDTATITALAVDSALYQTSTTAVVRIVPPPTFRTTTQVGVIGMMGNNGYALGDLDGDGTLDAVTSGSDLCVHTGSITVSGGRDFRFGPPRRLAGNSTVPRLANFDLDPALDIVALTNMTFDIYLNSGTGTFALPLSTPIGINGVSDMEVANLNNDSFPDIVIGVSGTGGGDVRVFIAQANGTFVGTTYGTVGTVTDVVLADVDDDGDTDIALGRSGSSVASVYRNDGGGSFGAAQDSFAGAPPQNLAVGDVTGDGFPDLVATVITTAPPANTVEVLRGSRLTPGTFTILTPSTNVQRNPSGLALADLDGDDDLDVIVTTQGANAIDHLKNDGFGLFTSYRSFQVARDPVRPVLADLDNDGALDVIVQSSVDNGLAFALNLGGAEYTAAVELFNAEPNIQGLAVGDLLGGDGRLDLAVITPPLPVGGAVSHATMIRNLTTSTTVDFQGDQTFPLSSNMSQPKSISIGDLDGQFGLDFVVGTNNSSTMGSATGMYFMSTGPDAWGLPTSIILERPNSCSIGDVDGDDIGEVVCSQDFSTGSLTDGSAVFDAGQTLPAYQIDRGFGAVSTAIGDLNHDGVTDYAVANSVTNDITVNLWTGMGYATATFNALPGISGITIGRVGEDDINDIVGVSSTGGVIIMEGDQTFGFGTPVLWAAGPQPAGVAGGDFNGDGLYDVMVMNPSSDTITILIASPQGGFFRPVTVGAVDSPSAFVIGDFDLDGRSDIAVGSSSSNAIMLILNNREALRP